MFVLVRFFILIDMLTFDNKFNIGSEVSANDMAVTFVVVAIFPRLLDNGSQYISYLGRRSVSRLSPCSSGEYCCYSKIFIRLNYVKRKRKFRPL